MSSPEWELVELEPDTSEFTHFYVIWEVQGRPELTGTIFCATSQRGWRHLVRLLPHQEYRRDTCHLRRFGTLRAALEAYRSEAHRFDCDASPRLRLC